MLVDRAMGRAAIVDDGTAGLLVALRVVVVPVFEDVVAAELD